MSFIKKIIEKILINSQKNRKETSIAFFNYFLFLFVRGFLFFVFIVLF